MEQLFITGGAVVYYQGEQLFIIGGAVVYYQGSSCLLLRGKQENVKVFQHWLTIE